MCGLPLIRLAPALRSNFSVWSASFRTLRALQSAIHEVSICVFFDCVSCIQAHSKGCLEPLWIQSPSELIYTCVTNECAQHVYFERLLCVRREQSTARVVCLSFDGFGTAFMTFVPERLAAATTLLVFHSANLTVRIACFRGRP